MFRKRGDSGSSMISGIMLGRRFQSYCPKIAR
jgi:hypothetical protein